MNTIYESLSRRVTQVDKQVAYDKVLEHLSLGNITITEAQTLADTIYPVQYEDVLDEEGNVVDKTPITERVVIDESTILPSKTVEEQIVEMAEQLVLAQEALDFIIMGGM